MAKPGRTGMSVLDRLILLVAWMVTCGLVYVLGFYVGKGTQERRFELEARVVRLPVTSPPPPEGQRPKTESGLTFYDTLGGTEPVAPRGGRERAPAPRGEPAQAPVPATPPAAVTPVATPRPAQAAPAAPPPAAPRPAQVPPAGPPAAATPPAPPKIATPRPPAAAAAPVATPTAPAPAAAATGAAAPTGPAAAAQHTAAAAPAVPHVGHFWTVQANPTRDRGEAESVQQRLRGLGYDATVLRVLRDGDTWYRVQVGRFTDSQQATEVMQRLREHEGVAHVFVASE
jgi:cell division protein FtsN